MKSHLGGVAMTQFVGVSPAAGRERPVDSKMKLWPSAIVGSATVPTSIGGHGGPPYYAILAFHMRVTG
jgi:hypothetical protein